jgi:hypothetical protein
MTLLQVNGQLRFPFGKRDTIVDNQDRKYHMLYHSYSKNIHQYNGRVYRSFPIRQTNCRYIHAELVASPIAFASTPGYPVNVISIQDKILMAKYQSQNTITTRPRCSQQHPRFGVIPDWEADLMRHTTIYEQHTPLLTTKGITIVTDGGVERGRGYFGIVLAAGATVIASMRGVARGDPRTMCSFRAEVHMLLAGRHLLINFLKITSAQDEQQHSIHTDSVSLLSRLSKATKAQVPVGFCLKTDSDVVMQIAAAAKEIMHIQRLYVKGQQDGKKKKTDLTQPKLYNIDADASSTIMRHAMKKPASQVIPFPAS